MQFIVEFYLGNALASRKQLILPFVLAVQQASDICKQIYEETQPIKVIFINSDNETLEYKNAAFIKFEGGN